MSLFTAQLNYQYTRSRQTTVTHEFSTTLQESGHLPSLAQRLATRITLGFVARGRISVRVCIVVESRACGGVQCVLFWGSDGSRGSSYAERG